MDHQLSSLLGVVKRLENAMIDLEGAFVGKLHEQQKSIQDLKESLVSSEGTKQQLETKNQTAIAKLDRLSDKIKNMLGA